MTRGTGTRQVEQGAGDGVAEGPPVVVRGRHTTVSERFRQHVHDKLGYVTRLDHKIIRLDVEVSEEHNPRQSHTCERVEITCVGRGPVVRAEAAAQHAYAALDIAVAKLEERLRRAADRRHSRGARVARLPRPQPGLDDVAARLTDLAGEATAATGPDAPGPGVLEGDEDGPFVVREKLHRAEPMSLDEALASMELVGHDFYLFQDSGCGTPSVVYRRRGYHYGVLRLGAPG